MVECMTHDQEEVGSNLNENLFLFLYLPVVSLNRSLEVEQRFKMEAMLFLGL